MTVSATGGHTQQVSQCAGQLSAEKAQLLLHKVPASADIAARLGIAQGDLCVRTSYEFLADGRPVQLSTNWEPYDLTAGTSSSSPREARTPGRAS